MTEEYVTIVKSLEKAVTEPDNEVRYFVEDGEDGGFIRYWESQIFSFEDGRYGTRPSFRETLKKRNRTLAIKKLNALLSS